MSYFCREKTEEGEFYSDKVVAEHTIFLLLAAHDTTTSTLTSIVYRLAKHPEWQQKLRDEFNSIGVEGPCAVPEPAPWPCEIA